MSACLTLRFLCALWCTLRVVLCTLYSIITIEAGLKLRLKGRCVSDVCTLYNVYSIFMAFGFQQKTARLLPSSPQIRGPCQSTCQ